MIIVFTIYMIVYALLSFIFLIILGIVTIGIFIFNAINKIINNIEDSICKFKNKRRKNDNFI